MRIFKEKTDGIIILKPEGVLDLSTSEIFKEAIMNEIEAGERHFIIDFAEVNFLSSAGIRIFYQIYKILKERQGSISLSGVNKSIADTLDIVAFSEHFYIYPSLEKAVEMLKKNIRGE